MASDHQKLHVWQKSMDLVVQVYLLSEKLPKEELYILSQQLRRCAISIPSNIAEGQSRNSLKEFIQFLAIAKGSKSELDTQIDICTRIGYLKTEQIEEIKRLIEEVGKMLNALQNSLKRKLSPSH